MVWTERGASYRNGENVFDSEDSFNVDFDLISMMKFCIEVNLVGIETLVAEFKTNVHYDY